jgi:TonB-dependent Receptor Plug Domain
MKTRSHRGTLLLSAVVALTLCGISFMLNGFRPDWSATSATLGGLVSVEIGASLPAAMVCAVNQVTDAARRPVANVFGYFADTFLTPGRYTLTARRYGFAAVEESVSVNDKPSGVYTSPAVGTVVDRQFVADMPLNGRSLQALLQVTPGVVTTSDVADGAQFSVNGQSTAANYFMVDGVGANTGMDLVLQEFQVETSTFAPEFGQMPGGQVSCVARDEEAADGRLLASDNPSQPYLDDFPLPNGTIRVRKPLDGTQSALESHVDMLQPMAALLASPPVVGPLGPPLRELRRQ